MSRQLMTVAQLAADPNIPLSEPSIRWLIFNARQNGRSEHRAIVRIGRRVYVDRDAFDRWVDAQQQVAA